MGHLGVLATADIAMIYVEGAVLLAQVVERLSILRPYWVAVLALEGGEFLILTAIEHPDVTCDRRCVVLAPFVLVALAVVVEHLSLGVDADVFHRQHGVEFRATALCAHLIYL